MLPLAQNVLRPICLKAPILLCWSNAQAAMPRDRKSEQDTACSRKATRVLSIAATPAVTLGHCCCQSLWKRPHICLAQITGPWQWDTVQGSFGYTCWLLWVKPCLHGLAQQPTPIAEICSSGNKKWFCYGQISFSLEGSIQQSCHRDPELPTHILKPKKPQAEKTNKRHKSETKDPE